VSFDVGMRIKRIAAPHLFRLLDAPAMSGNFMQQDSATSFACPASITKESS
jgi:hypothetical protein